MIIKVNCNTCNRVLHRDINDKYIREDGTTSVSSYCKYCRRLKIVDLGRTEESCGVRRLSKEEINKLNYTPPKKKVKEPYLRPY